MKYEKDRHYAGPFCLYRHSCSTDNCSMLSFSDPMLSFYYRQIAAVVAANLPECAFFQELHLTRANGVLFVSPI